MRLLKGVGSKGQESEDDMGLRTFLKLSADENVDEMEEIMERMDERFTEDELDRLKLRAHMEALRLQVDNMTHHKGAA